jgi:hypothetical protein
VKNIFTRAIVYTLREVKGVNVVKGVKDKCISADEQTSRQ